MALNTIPEGAEDLRGDGAVVKTVLVEGGGETPGRGARVSVKYALSLLESYQEPFDSSENREDGILQFTLGKRRVLAMLELAAQNMKEGEKCRVRVEPPYAFGSRGLKRKGVPPNAVVYMIVEMIEIRGGEKQKLMVDMTPAERFEKALQCKTDGNALFKELKYDKAMRQYSQCIRYLAKVFYKPAPPAGVATNADKEKEEGFSEAQVTDEEPKEGDDSKEEVVETIDATAGTGSSPIAQESTVKEEEVIETIDATGGAGSAHTETNGLGTKAPTGQQGEDTTEQGEVKSEDSADKTSEEKDNAEEESEGNDPNEKEVVELHVTTLNNLSLCFVKLDQFKEAVETASVSLKMDPQNSKALYYRYVPCPSTIPIDLHTSFSH